MKRQDYASSVLVPLSAADMMVRVMSDNGFPAKRRASARWAIAAGCRWANLAPAATPFNGPAMRAAFSKISPGGAGVSRKTLQNARADAEFVLRFYGLEKADSFSAPLSAEAASWHDRLDEYTRYSFIRLLRFVSARGIGLAAVDDTIAAQFRTALDAELPADRARATYQGAVRAWNKQALTRSDWPGRPLTVSGPKRPRALSWRELPASLLAAVDALYANRDRRAQLFKGDGQRRSLKPTTIRNRREHLRIAASVLATEDHIASESIVGLGDLCRPERFVSIMTTLIERHANKVTAYVEQVAITLLQAAVEGGELTSCEIEQVRAHKHEVYQERKETKKIEINRDQAVLDELDDDGRMNTLLALPTKVATVIRRAKTKDRRDALQFQLACALEIMFAAPLRITNFSRLRLDQHLHVVTTGKQQRYVIRVPGTETKNGRPLEHYLHDAAAALLKEYLADYRPMLTGTDSPWLFSGRYGNAKHAHVLGRQVSKFVWEGTGIRFHPHLMRKIVTKLILDDDPAAIEIARLELGHSDPGTIHSAYVQHHNRSAQAKYLKALQERRLAALDTLTGQSARQVGPRPLRRGKGDRARNGGAP